MTPLGIPVAVQGILAPDTAHVAESTWGHYRLHVDRMPIPGDLITAFSPQPGRCFRMVYSRQLQATHCYEPPEWKGIWKDRKGQSWYVEACGEHAPKARE